jgi:hypothetical protein
MRKLILSLFALSVLVGCEKPVFDGEDQENKTDIVLKGEYQLTFNAMQVEQTPFRSSSRSEGVTQTLAEVCNRISFVVFDGETKVSATHQTSSEKSFGSASVNLPAGTYTLVIIAHNGLANPTFTSPSKITFKDNKVTDTFYSCQQIVVDEPKTYDIVLSRAVAMFNLTIKDATPSDVKQMKFYYTGGSSTFNAQDGCGCVSSRQTEYREVPATAYDGESSYELYTFPHDDGRTLKMDVSALDSSGDNILYHQIFEDVPMTVNQITHYTGYFFGGEESDESTNVSVKVTNNWLHKNYTY